MSKPGTPVVVDLGSERSNRLRELKKGEGPLLEDVTRVLEDIRAESPELAGKELVPVVMIYRKKAKRESCRMPLCPIKSGSGLACPLGCK